MKIVDLRKIKPILFNAHDLKFDHDQINLDEIIYRRYLKRGNNFLNGLNGEFAFLFNDTDANIVFAVRDWVGEVPLHYIVAGDTIYFANFVTDLMNIVPDYKYKNVVALNRSEVMTSDLKTGRIDKRLYFNFSKIKSDIDYGNILSLARRFHDLLLAAVSMRMPKKTGKTALLLSGGIDSMSVAFIASRIHSKMTAYTLEIASGQATDVARARQIAKTFGLHHEIISVSEKDVIDAVEKSIFDSEIYHIYNVFCAVGMHLLAKVLHRKGVSHVFGGEGGNEIFGDYHDWVVCDPRSGQEIILQKTSKDFDEPKGREAYIWGNPRAEDIGRYNIQLGSGLGKHGGSRMYKPMLKHGVTLLSPYLEREIAKIGANIPSGILKKIGGKAGFMKLVFAEEIRRGEIPEEFFEIHKIRFQDASAGGESGITGVLLEHGFDQKKLIEVFNKIFKANVVERLHLKEAVLV